MWNEAEGFKGLGSASGRSVYSYSERGLQEEAKFGAQCDVRCAGEALSHAGQSWPMDVGVRSSEEA